MNRALPRVALVVLIVGLALHNLVMGLLTGAGVTGGALDVVSAWKELVLLAALVAAALAAGSLPRLMLADRLVVVYAAFVFLYLLLPQSWLDGSATTRGELYALRHHLLPVAAYALGRLLALEGHWWRRIGVAIVGTGAGLAVWGLADVYLVPLSWWRDSGIPDWFRTELGLDSECLAFPENWIFNTGDEQNPLRRLVSTFLTPLASGYLLVVALLLLACLRPRRLTVAASAALGAGLLWTHTRSAYLGLAVGLVVLALVRRSWRPAALAGGWSVLAVVFVVAFPTIGPGTSYTPDELICLRENAAEEGGEGSALWQDSSSESHWRNLRDGVSTVLRHPLGFGLGNAGVNASRTGVEVRAGESTYTELGVDLGLLGALAFSAWLGALIAALRHRSAWLTASLAAVAVIGLQTDVIGIHWLAVVVFALAGAAVRDAPPPA